MLLNRINPHNEAAKKGLERLEKQMKVRVMLRMLYYRPIAHASRVLLCSFCFLNLPQLDLCITRVLVTSLVLKKNWSNIMLVLAV